MYMYICVCMYIYQKASYFIYLFILFNSDIIHIHAFSGDHLQAARSVARAAMGRGSSLSRPRGSITASLNLQRALHRREGGGGGGGGGEWGGERWFYPCPVTCTRCSYLVLRLLTLWGTRGRGRGVDGEGWIVVEGKRGRKGGREGKRESGREWAGGHRSTAVGRGLGGEGRGRGRMWGATRGRSGAGLARGGIGRGCSGGRAGACGHRCWE